MFQIVSMIFTPKVFLKIFVYNTSTLLPSITSNKLKSYRKTQLGTMDRVLFLHRQPKPPMILVPSLKLWFNSSFILSPSDSVGTRYLNSLTFPKLLPFQVSLQGTLRYYNFSHCSSPHLSSIPLIPLLNWLQE